jgi:hypothetical protein
MGRKIKIYQTEEYVTYVVREPLIIDLDDYPELEGMGNEEVITYLEINSLDMKAQDTDNYDSLSDELIEQYVIKDKIYNNEFSYRVDDFEE